jgi:membrane protein YdbS with pleckstrin-like domain
VSGGCQMPVEIIHPNRRWVQKSWVALTSLLVLILVASGVFAYVVGLDAGGARGAALGLWIVAGVNALWFVPSIAIIPFYYPTLRYEIQDDEVIVRAGLVTRSVKHVPYRTVTNLKVTRGPFDRMFGLGTLAIQTAGMSGQTGAEESLVGLTNVQAVYDEVATALRRYRSAMSPTAADEDVALRPDGDLGALLTEVRAIREMLESRA